MPRASRPAVAATPLSDKAALPLDLSSALLGGLSPSQFMRRHWQKRPLLVRQAWPGLQPPVTRAELFRLCAAEDVESRLIVREGEGARTTWQLRHGPMPRRALPPLTQPRWTVLLQGLNLHVPAAHDMLAPFRFIPNARLDDLMVSWASVGGGVGPHVDSYDVFLIQAAGRRRWRIAPPGEVALRPGLPIKVLKRFVPTQEWVLEPGDMLYLPPGWQHDGEAVGGDCMTCSVGFRAPAAGELAREALLRLTDAADERDEAATLYGDAGQAATAEPGRLPIALQRFAQEAVQRLLREPGALAQAVGEYLSEPKPQVAFQPGEVADAASGVRLAPGSCMLYDDERIYLNGESWLAAGRDAQTLRLLADRAWLAQADLRRASRALLDWCEQGLEAGWLHPLHGDAQSAAAHG